MFGDLSPLSWLLIAFWGLVCVVAVPRILALWRGELDIFPQSMPSWRAYMHAVPLGFVAMVIMVIALPLAAHANAVGAWPPGRLGPEPLQPQFVLTVLVSAVVALVFILATLTFTVTLFNWPKLVVPPHMRDESGLLDRSRRDFGKRRPNPTTRH